MFAGPDVLPYVGRSRLTFGRGHLPSESYIAEKIVEGAIEFLTKPSRAQDLLNL
jgi:hypothetical protein